MLLEEEEMDCADIESGSTVTSCATRMRVVGKMAACAFVPAACRDELYEERSSRKTGSQ